MQPGLSMLLTFLNGLKKQGQMEASLKKLNFILLTLL